MDLSMASTEAADPRRWRDRRTLVAIVAALVSGGGFGIVAGVMAGSDVVVNLNRLPNGGEQWSIDIADQFDSLRAAQVGGVATLVIALVMLAVLGLGLANLVELRSLTRRRALIVGCVSAIAMVGPWLLVGVKWVRIHRSISGHPGPPFEGELAARALPDPAPFYAFDAIPALIAMVAILVALATIGSILRRSPGDADIGSDARLP